MMKQNEICASDRKQAKRGFDSDCDQVSLMGNTLTVGDELREKDERKKTGQMMEE